jgi:hypothetical protein
MSVDRMNAILVRATPVPKIIPSQEPDTAARDPTVVIAACCIESTEVEARTGLLVRGEKLNDGVEPCE